MVSIKMYVTFLGLILQMFFFLLKQWTFFLHDFFPVKTQWKHLQKNMLKLQEIYMTTNGWSYARQTS